MAEFGENASVAPYADETDEEGVCEDSDDDCENRRRDQKDESVYSSDQEENDMESSRREDVAVPAITSRADFRREKIEKFERILLTKTCFNCQGLGHLDYMCTSTKEDARGSSLSCTLCQGVFQARRVCPQPLYGAASCQGIYRMNA